MFANEVSAMTPLDRAYVLAGFRDSPWARYNASKLAHQPAVAARISELQAEFTERSGIRAEYLQRRLLPLVESDPRGLFEIVDDGAGAKVERLKPITQLPSNLAAPVSKIRLDPKSGAVVGVDLADKNSAANTLLRSVGGLIDRCELDDKRVDGEQRCFAEVTIGLLGHISMVFERYGLLCAPESVVHRRDFRDMLARAISDVVAQLADPEAADAEVDRQLDAIREQQRESRPRIHAQRSLPRQTGA
jgi:hypothetical protein